MGKIASIKGKITASLIIFFSLVLFLVSLSIINNMRIAAQTERIEQALRELLLHSRLKAKISNLETDILRFSSSRGMHGSDPGLKNAEKHFVAIGELLDTLILSHSQDSLAQEQKELKMLKEKVKLFHDVGTIMAEWYRDSGPEVGNLTLDEFTAAADEMNDILNELSSKSKDAIGNEVKGISSVTASSGIWVIILSLIITLIMLALSIVMFRAVQPLPVISGILQNIARGEGDLKQRIEINTKDEIGEISKWFNTFIEKLHRIITNISANTRKLSDSSTNLSSISSQMAGNAETMKSQSNSVASTAEQASANINHISASAEQMSGSVSAAATSVEEMSASLNEVAKNCQQESEIA
ncbi:HAMP domain-containing protein, partial [Fibrobacterota bacterium]